MQNELAMAGKHDASMKEIRAFVQRRCQYAQIPTNSSTQPFNQMSAPQPPAAAPQTSNSQPQQNREAKRKFDGQYRHCGIHGQKCKSGQNVENDSDKKPKTDPRIPTRNPLPSLVKHSNPNPNTIQN